MIKHKKESPLQGYIYLAFFVAIMLIVFFLHPDKALPALSYSWQSFAQFLMIFPAVVLLIGIFAVIATPEMVTRNFGKGTGWHGSLKALFFGSVMSTGPFYLSFPLAKTLIDKGATATSIVIFVSAWNGIAVIGMIMEMHFMGPMFMFVRCSLTAIFIFIAGYAAQGIAKTIFKDGKLIEKKN